MWLSAQIAEWTATEWGILMGALGTLIGVLLTKGSSVIFMLRKQKLEERKELTALDLEEDQQIEDQMKYVIKRSDRMLARAESEIRQLRDQYTRAIEALAEANTRVEYLSAQLAEYRAKLDKYRRAFNERHDHGGSPPMSDSGDTPIEGHSL